MKIFYSIISHEIDVAPIKNYSIEVPSYIRYPCQTTS